MLVKKNRLNSLKKIILSNSQKHSACSIQLQWAELCIQKTHIQALTLKPVDVTFFGDRAFADVIKLLWYHARLKWDLQPMTGILMRKGGEDTYYKRRQCDDGIRGWNRAATSQGIPRITSNFQKLRDTRNDSSLHKGTEGPQPCRHLDIGLLALRTVREHFFIVFGHCKTYPLFGTLLLQSWEINTSAFNYILPVVLLGEAHWLKLPTLARHHSNYLHELFYDRRSW